MRRLLIILCLFAFVPIIFGANSAVNKNLIGDSELDDDGTRLYPRDAGRSLRTLDAVEIIDSTNRIDMVGTALGIVAANQIYASINAAKVFYINDAGIIDMPLQSRCRVYRATSSQVVGNDSTTKIELNAKTYDTQDEFDSITNYRFTANETGWYAVVAQINYENLSDAEHAECLIRKNGTSIGVMAFGVGRAGDAVFAVPTQTYLAAGDYLEMFAYHYILGGGNRNVKITWTLFCVHKLS